MSDVNKLGFDPIPVLGSGRPELPKVPDLPSAKSAAPKPVESKAAPAPEPVAATPAAPTASSLWQLFEPNRTKGVIAAGIVSLLGGAATMKYLWPPKAPASTTAKAETEFPAPLPAVPAYEEPKPLPKVEPVTLVPIVPASGTPTAIELPKIDLPALTPASSPTAIAVPKVDLPALVSTPSSSPSIPLPELVRTSGTEPAKPAEIKLPELVPSAGTAPPIPTPVALPVPPTTAVPAPAPALLPLPEVKVEVPKDIRIDPPTLAPTAVPAAPKLPEIGLPSLTETPAPKIETPLPGVELKPEIKPLPATELPAISSVPVTATPASAVRPAPAPIAATPPRTDYDVDLHYVRAGDSWGAISKQHFGDERYADALKGFNQNASLANAPRVEVPPIHVLRKNYATLIGRPVEKSGEWGAIATSGATEPKRSITGGGYKMYTVPAGGRTLREIAADAFGNEDLWGKVWDTNPKLVPDKVVPEGTKIYLTSQAKIGE